MTAVVEPLLAGMTACGEPEDFHAAQPVSEPEVRALLGAARVAPSADNLQTWRFIVVREERAREDLSRAVPEAMAASVAQAPLVLVACGVKAIIKGVRSEQPFVMVDVPIAVVHLLLEARELGLGCAWTLDFDEGRVRERLAIPAAVRVIALLALGRLPGTE